MPWPEGWGAVDPAAFRRFVAETRVAPHAFHAWEHAPALWETTPFDTRARIVAWQEIFRHNQEARLETWKKLLAALAEADVPVIPLKGFTLSKHIYGDLHRRLSCDFDYFIRRQDIRRVNSLLAHEGFACQSWLGAQRHGEACWIRPGDPADNLDIHWALLPPWASRWQDTTAIWAAAHRSETDGIPHLQFAPEDFAWFVLLNYARDVGTPNLRGCVESLECLSLLPPAARSNFLQRVRQERMYPALDVLLRFRGRFFPATEIGWLTGPGRDPDVRSMHWRVSEKWHLRSKSMPRLAQEFLRLLLIGGWKRALPWLGYKCYCLVRLARAKCERREKMDHSVRMAAV